MEEAPGEALDVAKDADLIKEAQQEIAVIDILVCGACHDVFYFIQEFQNHKASGDCVRVANLKCEREEKPQVWGFTLWKTKRVKELKAKEEPLPTSWQMYEQWTSLPQLQKDTWISAGQMLQQSHRLANAKVQEVKDGGDTQEPLTSEQGNANVDPSAKRGVRSTNPEAKEEFNVERIMNKRFNARKRLWEYHVKWENYADLTWEPLAHLENCGDLVKEYEEKVRLEKEKQKEKTPTTGKARGRPRVLPRPAADGSAPVRIVAKKIGGGLDSSAILDSSLGGRPQRSSKQRALNQVKAWIGNISDDTGGGSGSLKRTLEDDDDYDDSDDSFEKKLQQEAASTANHDDSDSENDSDFRKNTSTRVSGNKRLHSGPSAKKIPRIVHQYANGGTTTRKLPDNVLIPDAKGVVRISQKQLPALSSGVYIMSKSSGIIKLDPTASKIATSGGQAIVKVSPKIGQTQIRIIKKDGGAAKSSPLAKSGGATPKTTVPQSTKSSSVGKKPAAPSVVDKSQATVPRLKTATSTNQTSQQPKSIAQQLLEKEREGDESDDGLEPLEFPTDLPLPEPDSPPGDFVLDPATGKVAGVEYPEVEPIVYEVSKRESTSGAGEGTESIDNIVKLAAADITEEDLKPSVAVAGADEGIEILGLHDVPEDRKEAVPKTVKSSAKQAQKLAQLTAALPEVTATPVTVSGAHKGKQRALQQVRPGQSVLSAAVVHGKKIGGAATKSGQSILNTALANSNILQKTLQSPSSGRSLGSSVTRTSSANTPRIINQTVVPRTKSTVSPVIRTIVNKPATVIRTKSQPLTPKPRLKVSGQSSPHIYHRSSPVILTTTAHHHHQQRHLAEGSGVKHHHHNQLYTKTNVARKIGNTTVYKTVRKETTIPNVLQQKRERSMTATSAVISMPSLEDETPMVVTGVGESAGASSGATSTLQSELGELTLTGADGDRPAMFITGDDGTVYQVAGQNEDGQTILFTQDSDGQQQCLLVTGDPMQELQQVEEQQQQHHQEEEEVAEVLMEVQDTSVTAAPSVTTPLTVNTTDATMTSQQLDEGEEQPLVAQFIRTEPPSPGGTHKVVVMLPDGNVMMTQVTPEEYATLALDK